MAGFTVEREPTRGRGFIIRLATNPGRKFAVATLNRVRVAMGHYFGERDHYLDGQSNSECVLCEHTAAELARLARED